MILKMYSIYDKKAELYHPPSYCHTVGHAMRVFTTLFSNVETPFNQFPDDFQVWEVGAFDDQSGSLVSLAKPHLVCQGTELMPITEPQPIPFGGPNDGSHN